MENVKSVISECRGNVPLYINDVQNCRKYKAAENLWLNADVGTLERLADILGKENVVVKYR